MIIEQSSLLMPFYAMFASIWDRMFICVHCMVSISLLQDIWRSGGLASHRGRLAQGIRNLASGVRHLKNTSDNHDEVQPIPCLTACQWLESLVTWWKDAQDTQVCLCQGECTWIRHGQTCNFFQGSSKILGASLKTANNQAMTFVPHLTHCE